MRQYTSKNYPVECFVDKATYQQFGIKSWQFLSPDILFAYDTISKFYGKKLLCNNWKEGGSLQYRGLRPQGCGVGVPYGVHYRGGALDFNVPDVAPQQVQLDLVKNSELWPQITRMEDITATPSWTHVDNGNMLAEVKGIYVFKP